MVSSLNQIFSQLPLPSHTQSLNLYWNRSGLLNHKRKIHLRNSVPHVPPMVPQGARELPKVMATKHQHHPIPMLLPVMLTLLSQLNKFPSSDKILNKKKMVPTALMLKLVMALSSPSLVT